MDIVDALDVLDGLAHDAARYRAGELCPEGERIRPAWILGGATIATKVVVNFVASADAERLVDDANLTQPR